LSGLVALGFGRDLHEAIEEGEGAAADLAQEDRLVVDHRDDALHDVGLGVDTEGGHAEQERPEHDEASAAHGASSPRETSPSTLGSTSTFASSERRFTSASRAASRFSR